jgi:hypothetical protein
MPPRPVTGMALRFEKFLWLWCLAIKFSGPESSVLTPVSAEGVRPILQRIPTHSAR